MMVFWQYADLKNAKLVANKIVEARAEKEIATTQDLIDVVKYLITRKKENQFLAQVFQAIRIEVNQEIEVLKDFLEATKDVLGEKGRFVVISYHSLEDRLVKNFFKKGKFKGELEKDFYGNVEKPFLEINRKVIVPTEQEIEMNSRSRSARLRIAEKV
jgi:16S rRNA (cytosine1402-N4)-methyltransferase